MSHLHRDHSLWSSAFPAVRCVFVGVSLPPVQTDAYTGHKACAACIAKLDRGDRKTQFPECFECRQPIVDTPHRVYLGMDEISQVMEVREVAALYKIDMNTPADSVQKAASKIRRAEERSKGDSATSVSRADLVIRPTLTKCLDRTFTGN